MIRRIALVALCTSPLWSAAATLCAQTLIDTQSAMSAGAEMEGRNAGGAGNANAKNQTETPAAGASGESASTASGSWPEFNLDPDGSRGTHGIARGPGFYLDTAKLVVTWLIFLAWVYTTDWVSRDCQVMKLPYPTWTAVTFFPFVVAFILMWLIPAFPIGLGLLIVAYGGSLGAYIFVRNNAVEAHQKVLTPDHLRHVFASKAKKVGVKVDTEKKADYEKGEPVELKAQGGENDVTNNANLLKARQSPGFVVAKNLIADVVTRRGEAVMLDYSAEAVAVRYQIDGAWHSNDSRDRESSDPMLAVMKTLAALKPDERRAKQAGMFVAEYNGGKYKCHLVSQGTKTGERALLKLDAGKTQFHTLAELGMRDKLCEEFQEILGGEKGMILFSSLPGGGLTTTIETSLEDTDRLMRNFVAVEEASRRDPEIENVEATTYNAAAGESPATVLPKLIRSYPDVIVVRDLVNAETAEILCKQAAEEDRLVISSVRAKEAPEALLRVLMMKVPAKTFAPAITAVLNVRLVRKLCEKCKVAYEPTPEILKKLGIPAGKIKALYREPKLEEMEDGKPCPHCSGVGYYGRTGIFELLKVNDTIREVLVKQPKLELLKKAAKGAGCRSLQEEGILLVARGVTSLQEMLRAMKT